jgi:hypothetical protein
MNKLILLILTLVFILSLDFTVSAADVQHFAADTKHIQLFINCTTPDCNEHCRIRLIDTTGYLYFGNAMMTTNSYTNQSNITITYDDVLLPKGTYKYNITCINYKGDKINQIQSYFTVGNSFPTVYVLLGIGVVVIIIFGIIAIKRRMEG